MYAVVLFCWAVICCVLPDQKRKKHSTEQNRCAVEFIIEKGTKAWQCPRDGVFSPLPRHPFQARALSKKAQGFHLKGESCEQGFGDPRAAAERPHQALLERISPGSNTFSCLGKRLTVPSQDVRRPSPLSGKEATSFFHPNPTGSQGGDIPLEPRDVTWGGLTERHVWC